MRPPTRTETLDYACKDGRRALLAYYTLGMTRHVRIRNVNLEEWKKCFDTYYGAYMFQTVLYGSFSLSLIIEIFLFAEGLWKSKKYSMLFYLNIMNIVLTTDVFFYIVYTLLQERDLFPHQCVMKTQILSIGFQMYFLALICVGVDCAIAVLYPLKYRTIESMKIFLMLNIGVFVLLIITQIIVPIAHVVRAFKVKIHCETNVFRELYLYYLGNKISSAIMILAVCVVNILITGGAIHSLIKRKKIVSENKDMVKSMVKIIIRSICLLGGNYGCLFLIFLYPFGFFTKTTPPTVVLSASLTVGIWNNVIFIFLDEPLRNRIMDMCRKKNINNTKQTPQILMK